MSKIKLLLIAIGVLVFLNISLVMFFMFKKPAHNFGEAPKPSNYKRALKNIIITKLNFNVVQINTYETLIQAHRKTIDSIDDIIDKEKANLFSTILITNDTANKKITINKLGALHAQIDNTHYQHFEAIKAICNAEQLKIFATLTNDLKASFSKPPKPRN